MPPRIAAPAVAIEAMAAIAILALQIVVFIVLANKPKREELCKLQRHIIPSVHLRLHTREITPQERAKFFRSAQCRDGVMLVSLAHEQTQLRRAPNIPPIHTGKAKQFFVESDLPRPFRSTNCPEAHQPILQELIPRGFRKVLADISRQLLDLFNPNHQSPISAFNTKPRIVLGKGYSCTRYVWPSVSQSP